MLHHPQLETRVRTVKITTFSTISPFHLQLLNQSLSFIFGTTEIDRGALQSRMLKEKVKLNTQVSF